MFYQVNPICSTRKELASVASGKLVSIGALFNDLEYFLISNKDKFSLYRSYDLFDKLQDLQDDLILLDSYLREIQFGLDSSFQSFGQSTQTEKEVVNV